MMRAVVYNEYGSSEVLHIEEVPKPTPKDNEILIKVHATSVNFGDLLARNFKNTPLSKFYMPTPLYLPVRIVFGWSKPKVKVLGSEIAGVVESGGKDVKKFKVGDEVFGYTGQSMGGYAEYICMSEDKMVWKKPENLSYEQAAAIPYGLIMANDHLKKVNIKAGQKILINGASGGIGSAGVQLAKHLGAEVTGVCGTKRIEFVKELGADHVIDYSKEDFTQNGETYDVIYDILGKGSFSKFKNSLKDNGTYLLASFKTGRIFQMLGTKVFGKKKVICALASENQEDMKEFKELAESGEIRTVIDRTFPLEEADRAHKYVEDGMKKGNVVLTLDHI